MSEQLDWGWRYAAVRPDHFRVEYAINPYMDVRDQPDPARALAQWTDLVQTLQGLGATVEVLGQRPDAPDMVYAMNLGLVASDDAGPRAVMSHMRFPERRMEQLSSAAWFAERGHRVSWVGRDGVGGHFESGDAFPFGDALVAGYGPRSDDIGLKSLAAQLQVRVRTLRLVNPELYHLDLAFCPLDARRAMVCPAAFTPSAAAALLDLVPEALVLSAAEAATFCANSVVVGNTVVMPACPPRVRAQLEAWGFRIVLVDVSELHLGGGSIRCLTNPLDIVVGRDLPAVPGGDVVPLG
jgi:N-dimethylarginine dimethylaminohydrolase